MTALLRTALTGFLLASIPATAALGLWLRRAPGGFVALWVWFDLGTNIATVKRFRLRLHKKPRVLWEVQRFNVVGQFMMMHDLVLVHEELLRDAGLLGFARRVQQRPDEPFTYAPTRNYH